MAGVDEAGSSNSSDAASSDAASSDAASSDTASSDAALTTLRGAGVDVNTRLAGRVVAAVCLVGLAVLVVILFVAGYHKNEQINRLRQHGVPVTVTVTGCLGLLGGSGSNPAGYACQGTFMLGGQHYRESIPGTALRPPGSKVQAVAVAGDPPLLSTRHAVATDRASASVYVVPAILLVVLVLLLGVVEVRRRSAKHAGGGGSWLSGDRAR